MAKPVDNRKPYEPTFFNPARGTYEPIHAPRLYPNSSKGYPGWVCRRGCGTVVPEDFEGTRCPQCNMETLIRYKGYEVKK
jgi:hypothetical protein